ncbi:hypothetical protein [uncultured Roseibium sp.]|uniref:hypothetical protein n=1 Tax=uncultured Roseibium sp. TaxID=1936171 RepID=UPI0032179A9D
MLSVRYLKNAYDHALGRPKTAFPTRYHYLEVVREDLAERSIELREAGQHCLLLSDLNSGKQLLVIVRYATEKDIRLIARMRQQPDTRIAYLLDDDIWAMLEDKDLRPDYKARLKRFLSQQFGAIHPHVDIFLAPSRKVLDRCPEFPGQYIQPAHMGPSMDVGHFADPGRIRMAFLSSSTHYNDFQIVAPGVRAALDKNPRLHLTTLMGKRGEDLIASGPQVTHLGDKFFDDFQVWLKKQRFHIALAPYVPNPVNDARSNLKLHQHAFVGAAGIYSPTSVFKQYANHGDDSLVVEHTANKWEEAIAKLAGDPSTAARIAQGGIENSLRIGDRHMVADIWANCLNDPLGS